MADYKDLARLAATISPANADAFDWTDVIAYLSDVWLDDYARSIKGSEIVEVSTAGFFYLFDFSAQRLIAAWGISRGRHGEDRDRKRMEGHPKNPSPLYVRGHAISHRMGGPTDINLVPQLGAINGSAFRQLENRAVKTPHSLYFTYWSYRGAAPVRGHPGQTPTAVDQGLLVPGAAPDVRHHGN